MSLQLFRPHYHTDEVLNEIRECLEKGWTGLGFKTIEFEENWKTYTGHQNAHFLNSNTSGLHLALNILGERYSWRPGDEIVTTPLTFVSTNEVMLYERLVPRFADVDGYLCLDPEAVERAIGPKTRAVMFVGMGGNTGRLDEVQEVCRRYELPLILDAAHMAGTTVNGRAPGCECDVSVYSFQAVKNLPTADAGMICWADPDNDRLARQKSWLGINKDTYERTSGSGEYKWRYDVDTLGFKYHGNSVSAAIGLVQLRYLERENEYRRQVGKWYRELLDPARARFIQDAPGCMSARHLHQIVVEDREKVMSALAENDIFAGVHYRDNREYRIFEASPESVNDNASWYSARILSLPNHMELHEADVQRVAEVVNTVA